MEKQDAALAGIGAFAVAAGVGLFATWFVKRKSRKARRLMRKYKDYEEAFNALLLLLPPAGAQRLRRCDKLLEEYFDRCRIGAPSRRASDLLESVIADQADPDAVEFELIDQIRKASSSEINQRAGLAAAAEFLATIRTLRRFDNKLRSLV